MSLLEKTIEYSLKKGYIKPSEVDSTRQAIQFLSTKYKMPEEWFVKTVLIESEGFYPSSSFQECRGMFQFCSNGTVIQSGGLAKEGYTLNQVSSIPPAEQARIWAKYQLEPWLKQGARNPQSAAEFYVINLFPAAYIAASKNKLDINTPIRLASPKSHFGKQAKVLYSDYNGDSLRLNSGSSEVTLASIERGLNLKVQSLFGEAVSSENTFATQAVNTIGSLANNAGQSIINGLNSIGAGIQSALLTGQNCPPPPYTQQDRIIYPGCLSKGSNPIFGNSLGSGPSAPAINGIGIGSNMNIPNQTGNNEPYSGELKPGGFVNPMKKGSYTFKSKFGWRWGRMHNGVDLAASIGTPIYASADGVVEVAYSSCPQNGFKGNGCGAPNFGGYGNILFIKHQGAHTLYAHLSSLLVSEGNQVKQGQLIATLGNSGSSTGPHIHYEIRLDSKGAIDPASIISF